MKTIDLDSWIEFERHVARLVREEKSKQRPADRRLSPMLFRGQRDAAWKVETTLERYGCPSLGLTPYYRAMLAAKPQIEAHTGHRWKAQSFVRFRDLAHDWDAGFKMSGELPAYEYMAYLRHHGFPSPLLDWSRSVYVAAYFAFSAATELKGRVAIFAYREGMIKGGTSSAPAITVRGPYVSTHKRHFMQQCQYTMCWNWDGTQWCYAPHEAVFAANIPDQDMLWKFTLPASERDRVLVRLDEFNLNAYSLFGSEESLMEVMTARELSYLRQP